MPSEALSFQAQQASGLEELAGAPKLAVNALTDMSGATRARPGIATWSGFAATIPEASAVVAMTVWNNELYYVTENRRMWKCDGEGAVTALSGYDAATIVDGALRPQMLSMRYKVVTVGGGVPQATDGVGLCFRLAGSPPPATTLAGLATRIILGVYDLSGTFQWSGLGDLGHTSWDALDYAEAEAKPDPIQAIADNTNELFVFGTETLQVFSPDAVVGFAAGRALNVGLLAPYSVVKVDDQFAFLDRERRFIVTDGRGFSDEESVLSKNIEATLRGIGTVEDCWGFRLRTDRWDVPIWFFPTDGIGYMWNRRNKSWSEWRAFGSHGYAAPTITSACYTPEANLFLVGLSSGQIAKLDATAYTDLGQIIKVELVTGFIDHGTDNRKRCVSVKFVFRRGQAAQAGSQPQVQICYRDDLGPFCSPSTFSLGLAGDYDPVVEMRSEGVYRRRQWKLEFTSAAEFSFIGAKEEFEPLVN